MHSAVHSSHHTRGTTLRLVVCSLPVPESWPRGGARRRLTSALGGPIPAITYAATIASSSRAKIRHAHVLNRGVPDLGSVQTCQREQPRTGEPSSSSASFYRPFGRHRSEEPGRSEQGCVMNSQPCTETDTGPDASSRGLGGQLRCVSQSQIWADDSHAPRLAGPGSFFSCGDAAERMSLADA